MGRVNDGGLLPLFQSGHIIRHLGHIFIFLTIICLSLVRYYYKDSP